MIGLLAALVGLGALPASGLGDESRLYVAGRRAVLDQRWNEAVLYLTRAIEMESREGEEVVIYGKHLELYAPHFYLGVAFFELGALDAADEAWRESDRQGTLRDRLEISRHSTLADYVRRYDARRLAIRALEEARERLDFLTDRLDGIDPGATTALREEADRIRERVTARRRVAETANPPRIDASLDWLDEIERLEIRAEILARETERARWERMLQRLERAECDPQQVGDLLVLLEEGNGSFPAQAAAAIHRLIESCASSRTVLLELSLQPALLGELEKILSQDEALRDLWLVDRSEGLEHAERAERGGMEGAGCDRGAMASVARSLERRVLSGSSGAEIERTTRWLAEAHRECGESGLGRLYLEGLGLDESRLATKRAETHPGEVFSTPPSLEEWIEMTIWIDAGACDLRLVETLESWIEVGFRKGDETDPSLYLAKSRRNCGDREAVGRFLAEARQREGGADETSNEIRALESWYRERLAGSFYTGRYALVFGASDYGDARRGWGDLPGARRDAEAVREALVRYGFDEVRSVVDPTSRDLRREIDRFIERHGSEGSEDHLLLVYWAGHATVLEGRYGGRIWSTGFLVPVDAPFPHEAIDPESTFIDRAVSLDRLERWAREIRSNHALFLLDSCYSETAFRFSAADDAPPRQRPGFGMANNSGSPWDPFARFRPPVRLVVSSSAADQRAADESAFRRSLVDLLDRPATADYHRDQVVSGAELCLHLAESTRRASSGRQSPACRTLPAPWNRGDVIFAASSRSDLDIDLARWARFRLLADLATWRSATGRGVSERDVSGASPGSEIFSFWAEYLRHFPSGRFASLAP